MTDKKALSKCFDCRQTADYDCKKCPVLITSETEDEKIREAFEKDIQYKNAHSPEQAEDRYTLFSVGHKSRQQEIEELKACNKILAEVNLNNAGKIAELEEIISIQKEDLENTRIFSSEKDKQIDIQKQKQTEDEKIREAFESSCYPEKTEYCFSIYEIGRNDGYKSRQQEIEEWKNEFHRVDSEKDDLLLVLSEKDKWISVEDRLPEIEVNATKYNVVYRRDDGSKFVTSRYFDNREKVFSGPLKDDHKNVTHWQPLPELPKDKE